MAHFSDSFEKGITVHGFQTGTVAVKKPHYQYNGPDILKLPSILLSWRWTMPLPIWVWLVETPFGKYLIDTGESTHFYQKNHFSNPSENYVNRKILKIDIQKEQQINAQLDSIGLSPNDIDAVLYTHLHIDHTDGMDFFSHAEHLVHQAELAKPFGVAFSTFPKWFKPKKIQHQNTPLPFAGSYNLDPFIELVSTPGHTWGHQSVIVHTQNYDIFLAGDTTFNEFQLLQNKVGGINVDTALSKTTLKNIQLYCRGRRVLYLPSHDQESGKRLSKQIVTLSV